MKNKQFCTVFDSLLNCFLLGLHMTVEEEDQVSNASLLPPWPPADITTTVLSKSMEMAPHLTKIGPKNAINHPIMIKIITLFYHPFCDNVFLNKYIYLKATSGLVETGM